MIDPRLHSIVSAQPYPLVFATISGAHLYGFPSPDSDFDLRGAHVLPIEKVVGLDVRDETVEDSRVIEGLEMDIVSHDVRKFFGLLLKKNCYQTNSVAPDRLIAVLQGWDTTAKDIQNQLGQAEKAGAARALVSYIPIEQSWHPRILDAQQFRK